MKCPKCQKPMHKNGTTTAGKQRYACRKCGVGVTQGKTPPRPLSELQANYYQRLTPEQKAARQARNTELQRQRRAKAKQQDETSGE